MATPFRLKRSAIEGKRPAESDLQRGELALNTYDGYLYTEREGVGLSTVTNLTPWYENYGGGSIYYSNSVGIGTTVPQYNLDVRKGSIGGYDTLVAQHSDVIKVIAVTVASKTDDHRYQGQGSGNAYLLDGIQSPILTLTPGRTYRFTNDNTGSHPFKFYLEADKTTNYTTGVNFQNTYTEITISDETPNVLHYQCTAHAYMGNAIVTNSNVVNSNYAATLRGGLDVTSGDVDITQNLNVTGNLDVDGNTTLDVTTIDGLLDINAGGQANTFKVEDLTSGRVVIAGTGGELEDNSNLTFDGTDLTASSLIVSDLTSGRVVLAGGSGAVEDNANLKFNTTTSEFEVVGHTVLDSLNVSGLSTFSANINLPDNVATVFGSDDDGSIKHTGTNLQIFETTGNIQITNFANDKDIDVRSDDGSGGTTLYFKADGSSGEAILYNYGTEKLKTTSSGISVTGSAAVSGDLTVTGNVGIAGTLTYEDVSRVDAVGLSTFREGLFIPDNQKAQFGNAAGSADLNISHNGSDSLITNSTGILKITGASGQKIDFMDGSNYYARFNSGSQVDLFHNNNAKFATKDYGVSVNGNIRLTTGGDGYTFITDTDTGMHNPSDGILNFKVNGSDRLLMSNVGVATFSNINVEMKQNLDVSGHAGIGSLTVAGVTTSTGGFVGNLTGTATLATDLAINGTNQLLYQASNNDSAILPTGNAGQILQSNGAGSAPQWITSAPAGAIEGITIREESSVVGSANSISTINFIGQSVTADAAVAAGIATITIDAISGVLVKEDEANVGTAITAFDFSGSLVDVDAVSNTGIATVQIDGLSVKDEGSSVGTAGSITTLNFVGAGIVAAASGDTATVTVAGGVSNADVVALAIALG